jgi:hypothetical protein
VTDSRAHRDNTGPIRLDAVGAGAAGAAVGLELGLLAYYFQMAPNRATDVIFGVLCATVFGLWLHFKGFNPPHRRR